MRATARGRRASWSVVCDFDGTVSTEDVTDGLLRRFARPGWQALEAAWQAGRIGSRDCMAGQVALLDCSRDELDAHVATVAIDPGFRAFVATVESDGATIAIASDGLGDVIGALLAREGLARLEVRATRLVQTGRRDWALEFPHARADCASGAATCKCAALEREAARAALVVGDGDSDACVAAHADLTFAKSRLLATCAARRIPHRPIADFADALDAWRALGDAAGHAAAAIDAGAA